MAQAAWTRPTINLSSWSCVGPRRRAVGSHSASKDEGDSPKSSASGNVESYDQPLCSPKKGVNSQNMNLPVSSSVEEWYSEIGCAKEMGLVAEVDVDPNDSGDDMMEDDRYDDHMSEVELWQQLEHELYGRSDGEEADVVKEIREEEAAAMAEVTDGQTQSSAPEMKEVHRFFPPGKIMHIVTLHYEPAQNENDGSPTSRSSDSSQPDETKIGIFQTSRSLYSKIRLSQTMISDHFMPVYRKQIERLIKELEEESTEDHRTQEVVL